MKRLVGAVVAGKESDGASVRGNVDMDRSTVAVVTGLFDRGLSCCIFDNGNNTEMDVDSSSPQRASRKKGKGKAKKG